MAEAVRTAARSVTGLEPPDYLPYLLRGNAVRLWLAGSPHVPEHCWVPTPPLIHDLVSACGLDVLRLTEPPDVYWSFRYVGRRRAG